MFSIARWIPRMMCGLIVVGCTDATRPTAPPASTEVPSLSVQGEGPEPAEEEFAEMPSAFRMAPTLLNYWTDVGFMSDVGRAYAQGFMKYFGTNATQNVKASLRFENQPIGSSDAYGEASDFLPSLRTLWTTAQIGVSGSCGHLADGATIHKAWHQFVAGGWKFFSWGNTAGTSGDSAEQPGCPPTPPPPSDPGGNGGGGGDGTDGYEGECEICQEWLQYYDGQLVDVWWECEPVDPSVCEAVM